STFIYLYYSNTIEDTVSTSYISYNNEEDAIITEDYKVGFDDEKLFWDEFRLKEGIDFSNDLLDREKMRINGTIWPMPEYSLSENDLLPIDYWVESGKIRVMRKVQNEVTVYGVTQITETEKHFYHSFLQVPAFTISIDEIAGITMLRNSYDLSSESVGTIISTSNNESILVDGNPDTDVQTDIESVEMSNFWIKMAFENKSLVTVGDYSGISDDFLLYYYDNISGGTNDGTEDTGDMVSYGDIGMRFNNPNTGEHIKRTNIYASIEDDLSGITCQSYFDNYFVCEINEEVYAPLGISNNNVCLSSNISLSNYPNPFNPSTTIKFYLPINSFVNLSIFNIKGQKIKQLINEETPKGNKSVVWNGIDETGNSVSSGIYLYHIQTDQDQVSIKRMILMK
ncbi:MAG: T9SS type A sorting domain-containing protein, partial [Bacteroidetes bacterium]|nr:T9SS type A sorting domain-containing protein [Bacteroidota bacterium]